MKSLPRFLLPLFLTWSIVVMILYFINHAGLFLTTNPDVTTAKIVLFFVFVVSILAVIGGVFGLALDENKKIKKVKIRVIYLLPLFLVLMIFLSMTRFMWDDFKVYEGPTLIIYEDQITVYDGQQIFFDDIWLRAGTITGDVSKIIAQVGNDIAPYFSDVSFWSGAAHTTIYLSLLLFGLILIMLPIYALGGATLKFLKKDFKKNQPLWFLTSIGCGTILFSLLFFVLSKLSVLSLNIFLVIAIVSVVLGYSSLKELIKWIFEPKITLSEIKWWQVVFGGYLFLMCAFNFIQSSSPVPSGYDDFNLYINLPHLLASTGTFINGQGSPYAFSLIQSIGFLISEHSHLAQLITLAFGFLALGAIYELLKKFFGTFISLLTIAALTAVPMIAVLSHIELKVELPLLFFGTLSLLFFDLWMSKKDIKWLFFVGLFAGFAASIKLTSIMLMITVFLMVLLVLLTRKIKIKKPLIAIAFLIIGFGLPLLPWMAHNLAINQDLSINGLLFDYNQNLIVDYESLGVDPALCESTGGTSSDYGRYTYERTNPILQFLMMPWDLTLNVSPISSMINIGFLFLSLAPFLILGYFYPKKFSQTTPMNFWVLIMGGFIFSIIWMIMSLGVPWYGISGGAFFIMGLSGVIYFLNKKSKLTRYFVFGLCTIWLIFGLFFRVNLYVARTVFLMPHIAGLINYETYVDNLFPSYLSTTEVINQNAGVVYTTNKAFFTYFIDNNHERVFKDQFLDVFNCLNNNEQNPEALFDLMSELGVKYIVLSRPVKDVLFNTKVEQASADFLELIKTRFALVSANLDTYVFETN